jgi:hypothetical protein
MPPPPPLNEEGEVDVNLIDGEAVEYVEEEVGEDGPPYQEIPEDIEDGDYVEDGGESYEEDFTEYQEEDFSDYNEVE